MVVVAVAGGTGGVGRTIVDALVATGKHQVKILSRSSNPALEAELGVPIIAVDYTDIAAVTKTLEDNNVHTVISAIIMIPYDGSTPREIELIRAADASRTTKRMISSDWGLPHKEHHAQKLGSVVNKQKAFEALKATKDLEYTVFHNGFFIDYWTTPGVETHLNTVIMFIDIAHNTAAIPGRGDTSVAFTHTTDVARFVAAALDLQKWEPITSVIADRVTLNELLHFAEEAKGTKFDVVHDSLEKLEAGEVTELPIHLESYDHIPKAAVQGFSSTFGLWFEAGDLDFKPEKLLNDQFPEIKPRKVKDLVEEAWKKA